MKYLQNLHTHTVFGDGKNTPEELVERAIELGFEGLGFSEHSYMSFSSSPSMSEEQAHLYRKEIAALKEKYKDKINLFCGLEWERFSEVDLTGYDYVIGSLHYLKIGEEYVGFDRDAQTVKNIIDKYFGGNGLSFAEMYFNELATLPDIAKIDIVGHFDLITKNIDFIKFFDESSAEYRAMACETVRKLAYKVKLFEVNTGAISRGYRKTPYPRPFILEEIRKAGAGVIISSDCHDKDYLNCWFDAALELVKSAGFKEAYKLTDNGFKPFSIV